MYNIVSDRGSVGRFCLFKSAYRIGEEIVGSFDFSDSLIICLKVKRLVYNRNCKNCLFSLKMILSFGEVSISSLNEFSFSLQHYNNLPGEALQVQIKNATSVPWT